MADVIAFSMFMVLMVVGFVCVVWVPDLLDRRSLKREWAEYDAERAAEAERQRLNPGSRPIPCGGRPSASRPS